jgi:hypothetical protein
MFDLVVGLIVGGFLGAIGGYVLRAHLNPVQAASVSQDAKNIPTALKNAGASLEARVQALEASLKAPQAVTGSVVGSGVSIAGQTVPVPVGATTSTPSKS